MKFFYALLFIFLFHTSFATTYYISVKGNDNTGSGTAANPWKTLYKATSSVSAQGDIIHVNAGIYTETVQCQLVPGVSIEGDGITSVIKSTLTSDFTAIIVAASVIEGTNGNQHISNLLFDGQNLVTSAAISVYARNNFSVHHCSFINFKLAAAFFTGKISLFPNNEEPTTYATGNSFYNNATTNCAGFTTYGFGHLWITGQQDMLVHDNIMSQTQRIAGQNGWLIKATDFTKGLKIYNNTLTKAPYPYISGGFNNYWDFAIEMGDEQGLEIYNNNIQGSIDMNRQSKGSYAYSVYIHDNVIGYPTLGKGFETGIIFEYNTEAAIVENNTFRNITEIMTFSTRSLSVITDISITKNLAHNIGQAGKPGNGSAINFISDGSNNYTINNFTVSGNTFEGNAALQPLYGISFSTSGNINNVNINNNTLRNFSASAVGANNGSAIDSIFIKKNTLSGNGYNNRAVFINGQPEYFVYENNITSKGTIFSFTNIKMNIIKPLYYGIKNISVLELVAVCAAIFGIWFCRKENIYFFPLWLITVAGSIFLSFEEGFIAKSILGFYFILLSVYGWHLWGKRDNRKHRIVRVTTSSKKELLAQVLIFAAIYTGIFIALKYFNNDFGAGTIAWADAFVIASACIGMWLAVNKKVESWYWWIAVCAASIPLYFAKYFIVSSAYYSVLLIFTIGGLYEWKKRSLAKKKVAGN